MCGVPFVELSYDAGLVGGQIRSGASQTVFKAGGHSTSSYHRSCRPHISLSTRIMYPMDYGDNAQYRHRQSALPVILRDVATNEFSGSTCYWLILISLKQDRRR